jgi:hypothetical protein
MPARRVLASFYAGEEGVSFFLHPPAIDFASEGSQLYQQE